MKCFALVLLLLSGCVSYEEGSLEWMRQQDMQEIRNACMKQAFDRNLHYLYNVGDLEVACYSEAKRLTKPHFPKYAG